MKEKHGFGIPKTHTLDLTDKFPPGFLFEKLQEGGEPYCCAEWKHDRQSVFCMYYKISSNEKRIVFSEFEAASNNFKKSGVFSRKDFKALCPISHSDGDCGFAVIGRMLEKLFDAEYAGRDRGFIRSGKIN